MNVNFMDFNSCKSSIKQYIQQTQLNLQNGCTPDIPVSLKIINSVHKGSRRYYDVLTSDHNLPKSCLKWSNKLGEELQWQNIFLKLHKIQDVKLKWLQMRIIHRILGTNVVLKEMGLVDHQNCNFCSEEKESIDHIFRKCPFSRQFWDSLAELFKSTCDSCVNLRFSERFILFGADINMYTNITFDFITLLGKKYIYSCKLENKIPQVIHFQRYLAARYKIEEYNARLTWNLQSFKVNWSQYLPCFTENN